MAKFVRTKKLITNYKLLIIILLLAGFLRLWKLGSVPPSASLDEVSIGWNAYSILKTGADEYGNRFPALLRAYDDWRPALYVYLVIPFVRVFGLNVVSVRLPAVILSTLSVLAVYFLAIELFKYYKNTKAQKHISNFGLVASFLLAISPWHIYISRLGHEANAGLAFLVFAVLFFFRDRIIISSVFFVVSFMSYQSEKIIIPLVVLGLLVLFYKKLLRMWKKTLAAGFLGLILVTPFLIASLQPDALIRFKGTSIFKENPGGLQSDLKLVGKQYLKHFSPKWLFTNIGREDHKVPNLGLLYIWEAPLILAGIYTLIKQVKKNKLDKKIIMFLSFWLLISPLPAAITTGAPHAMRAYTMLPVWQILEAVGCISIFVWINKYLAKKFFVKMAVFLLGGFIIFGSLFQLYRNYFIIFPQTQSNSFQYALHESIKYALSNQHKYKKIIFSNKENLYQSYMFFLYNSKYDPKLYQKQGGTVSGGFAETHSFGKYEFRPIVWEDEKRQKNSLYVGNPDEIPGNGTIQFRNLDEKVAVEALET